MNARRGKIGSITLILAAQVAALTLWFSATAVAPDLQREHGLSDGRLALLALAVQLGFVAGGVASAMAGLADRADPRRLFAACALAGAAANAALLVVDPAGAMAILSRFGVGLFLAGVYPVGMKMAAGWADKGDAGLLVGLLVGALTLGSAAPHGLAFLGGVDWRAGVLAASAFATAAAVLILFVELGPKHAAAARFRLGDALDVVRDRGVRLTTLGYLGHMWELYAGWTWIGALLAASFAAHLGSGGAASQAKLASFAVVGVGALGCVGAGWLADRIGRTAVTIAAMTASGLACLLFAAVFGAHPAWIIALGLIWGVAVIADSAQFSASVSELARPGRVGTMLTVQTALGFALTAVSIRLLPAWADMVGWRWAFAPLAIGPALGVIAMARLRMLPEARRLAGGRR